MIKSRTQFDDEYLAKIQEDAIRLAKEAGKMASRYFGKELQIKYKTKGRRDPVSEADREIETYIRAEVKKLYPDHAIVGEEFDNTGNDSADYVWIIDPVDGTNNFVNQLEIFACSLAIVHRGTPVVAAIFLPSGQEGIVFHARLGHGTFKDKEKIQLSDFEGPQKGRLTGLPSYYWAMFGFKDGLRRRIGEIRSLGSVVYELAMTATGTMQASLFYGPKSWDVAAGILLVQEAGGLVLTWDKKEKKWIEFVFFGKEKPSLENLYDWNGAVLAGNQFTVKHIADRVWFRKRLIFRIIRWIREKKD
jgi:myo-inositol-1(or 4)-monophosphatase